MNRTRKIPIIGLMFLAFSPAGCSSSNRSEKAGETEVLMDFSRAQDFYSAPFPSEDLRNSNGTIALEKFPNPDGIGIVNTALDLASEESGGFAVSGGVFFELSGEIDQNKLPDIYSSVSQDSSVFIINAEEGSKDYLKTTPIEAHFESDGGPFGSPNLLSLIPLQGTPLRPYTTYAALVMRSLTDVNGLKLKVSDSMSDIKRGIRPREMPEQAYTSYENALANLKSAGINIDEIGGLAVFQTSSPTDQFGVFLEDALSNHLPQMMKGFESGEIFNDYCVYSGTIGMPVYQEGTPPYLFSGGGWTVDESGNPIFQRIEEANIVVTIPRSPMPAAGFPVSVFIRTGGGGDRPMVDRGHHSTAGGSSDDPGEGPALYFAKAGFAGISVDGPHGGLRNVSGLDEQFLIFNILNPVALRDNIRQSALELVLLANIVEGLSVDASGCTLNDGTAGPQPTRFDTGKMAIMGHSMGATIAPLTVAFEPQYRAMILSGAGGSWIENIMYKKKPLEVKPLAELILHYPLGSLEGHDPVLSIVQWAAEPADPQVYDREVILEPKAGSDPRHVLMFQGIVDNYILPRIANTTSLSIGLDLAGEPLDAREPSLAGQTPLTMVLPFSGRTEIPFPAYGNITTGGGMNVTGVVSQHKEDGIEDGHEVVFQKEEPKHQYRCFLESFARGIPAVPEPAGLSAPCE